MHHGQLGHLDFFIFLFFFTTLWRSVQQLLLPVRALPRPNSQVNSQFCAIGTCRHSVQLDRSVYKSHWCYITVACTGIE